MNIDWRQTATWRELLLTAEVLEWWHQAYERRGPGRSTRSLYGL